MIQQHGKWRNTLEKAGQIYTRQSASIKLRD